ncbi:MAG: molybdenum cofactor guanylyltransferase [Phycisphaerae bacterium]|nr:molybdenum cofactor guanylyltransferase [Phycisphaerae bacterium]
MNAEHAGITAAFLDTVQPVVLVGGRSRRFGRDKLREPFGEPGRILVQRPIETLRELFGQRVKLVGDCHPSVRPLADGVIVDEHPGIGPMGGIISALNAWPGPVFVLAGDMPNFSAADARRIVRAAELSRDWQAVLAQTDRPHPCAGMYSASVRPILTRHAALGSYSLASAIREASAVFVPVDSASAHNVNAPHDLPAMIPDAAVPMFDRGRHASGSIIACLAHEK